MVDVTTLDARRNLAELLNRVCYGKERLVLTRRGKRMCALVPLEDLTLIERLRATIDERDTLAAASERASGQAVLWDDLRRELGLME